MPKKIVVSIDDESFILKLVEAVLKDEYDVHTFSDSEEALAACENDLKPDLIICDINMPKLDGFELHESLRTHDELKSVPFIYVTALTDRKHFRQGMQQGADDYLTKPFSPQELKDAVEARFERTDELLSEEVILKVLSLGGVGASAQGTYLQYEAKKVVALLLYLITHDGEVPLRIIPGDLWRKEVGENNIHVLINRARKTFEGYVRFPVKGDILTLELLTAYEWDAALFEEAAKEGVDSQKSTEIEKAIQLYKGVFLPGFDDPWAEQQRSYYDSLFFKLLELSIDVAKNKTAQESAQARLESFLEGS